MAQTEVEVIARMRAHLQEFLEQSHPVFGGLPVCPFVQSARMAQKICFRVEPFSLEDLQPDTALMQVILEFAQTEQESGTSVGPEVLWFIHPDPAAISRRQVQQFVARLNEVIAATGLIGFGGHPEDGFNVASVYTRRDPFANVVVQSYASIRAASQVLSKTRYYEKWSDDNLQEIGFPRV